MPLFSSSRKPSARTRAFIKELARVVPGSEAIGRGKQPIEKLAEAARQKGYSRVAVVTEMHGNPHTLRVLDVDEEGWRWIGGVAFKSVKLAREFGGRTRRPDMIASSGSHAFASLLGIKAGDSSTVLQQSNSEITFFQDGKEVGPRMVLG